MSKLTATKPKQSTRQDYYDGVLGWDTWKGNTPNPDDPSYNLILQEISKLWVSSNKIRQAVDKITAALISNEPHFAVLKPNRQPAGKKFDNTFANWYADFTEQLTTEHPFKAVIRSALINGYSFLRVYESPQGFSIHHTDNIAVERDGNGDIQRYLYHYQLEGQPYQEIQRLEGETLVIETYQGDTLVEESRLELGGNFLIYICNLGESIITESAMQLQDTLNGLLTQAAKTLSHSGFQHYIIANAKLPQSGSEGFKLHAGAINFVEGSTGGTRDNPKLETPSVTSFDPADPKIYVELENLIVDNLLAEFGMLHQQISGQSSGISRKHAIHTFSQRCEAQRIGIQSCLTGIATSLIRLLTGNSQLRVRSELQIIDHLLDSEEQDNILKQFNAGVISQHTALEQLRYSFPDEEISKVEDERDRELGSIPNDEDTNEV